MPDNICSPAFTGLCAKAMLVQGERRGSGKTQRLETRKNEKRMTRPCPDPSSRAAHHSVSSTRTPAILRPEGAQQRQGHVWIRKLRMPHLFPFEAQPTVIPGLFEQVNELVNREFTPTKEDVIRVAMPAHQSVQHSCSSGGISVRIGSREHLDIGQRDRVLPMRVPQPGPQVRERGLGRFVVEPPGVMGVPKHADARRFDLLKEFFDRGRLGEVAVRLQQDVDVVMPRQSRPAGSVRRQSARATAFRSADIVQGWGRTLSPKTRTKPASSSAAETRRRPFRCRSCSSRSSVCGKSKRTEEANPQTDARSGAAQPDPDADAF